MNKDKVKANLHWILKRLVVFVFVGLSLKGNAQDGSKTIKSSEDLNIVLIHVDDLGWTDLGVFGSDFYETPYIDKLAEQGLRFTNSYAAAAICSPTRAALLTGKYPARTGITDWIRARFQGGIIPEDGQNPSGYDENEDKPLRTPQNYLYMPLEEVTIAELLKERGYKTAHIGKWHLGPDDYFPEHQGFDINIGGCDLGQPPSYFDPYLPFNGNPEYVMPNLEPRKEGEYLTDREGDEAVEFIRKHQKEPFFIHWATYTVHTPLMGKEVLVEKYKNKTPGNQTNPTYGAMVESLDDNIGKLIEALDELGIADKTLVIFTSDNGGLINNPENPVTNNTPLRSQKGYPYEGGIRVPTIMRWPGKIPAGVVTESPLITMDMLPTILSLVDGSVDESKWDGMDYSTFIQKPTVPMERDLYWYFPHYRGEDVVPYAIIRSGDFKYIRYFDERNGELYNLKEDLGETINLYLQNSSLVKELDQKLDNWLEETKARLPQRK
ncbi:sulfatase [Algoriphagus vanfongensis]|uniref:sulfatase n=1 Tax=Algoriphagus vanfongensis TaxID=426371 RepID=UPI000409FF0D|nr:sulfatase [Algoriphagus vanfongensis]